jgi:hypothetical protein
MKKIVFIDQLDLTLSPQTRHEINHDAVEEYSAAYKAKEKLPDPVVFLVGKVHLIADGFHRVSAMKQNGMKAATFEVKTGTREDAVTYALQSNINHGLRRTNADKRVCVQTALIEFPSKSDLSISEVCKVSDNLVKAVRKELESSGKVPKVERRVGKDGKEQPAAKPKADKAAAPKEKDKDHEDSSAAPAPAKVQSKGKPETDDTDYPIPEKAMVYWSRSPEVEELLSYLTTMKSRVKKAHTDKDIMYSECNTNSLLLDIERVYSRMKLALPYAVCPYCQGKLPEKCKFCFGRGVISKFKYDSGTPEELKKVRSTSCKK